jgi:hypothetical protein
VKNSSGGVAPLAIVIALAALGLVLVTIFLPSPGDDRRPEALDARPGEAMSTADSAPTAPRGPAEVRSPEMMPSTAEGNAPASGAWASGGPAAQGQTRSRQGSAAGEDRAAAERAALSRGPAGETVLVAELDGDGSGYILPSDDAVTGVGSSPVEMQAAVLSAATPEETKLDLMADLVPQFGSDEEAINFLRAVASDTRQPGEVRADAVAKLADFGPQHVASFASSDSSEVAAEVDLIRRLEEFRVQEGLPPGAVRAGGP